MKPTDLEKLQKIHQDILWATAKIAPIRRRASPEEVAILAKAVEEIESAVARLVELYR